MNPFIRYPLNLRFIIGMALFGLIEISGLLLTNHGINKMVFIALIVFDLLAIAVAITRTLLKPKQLKLEDNVLYIGLERVNANEIKHILIERDRVIGVLPKNKRIVPMPLCFVFESSSGNGLPALLAWAKSNDIKVEHRTFRKWM